jgi:hypothetical protein
MVLENQGVWAQLLVGERDFPCHYVDISSWGPPNLLSVQWVLVVKRWVKHHILLRRRMYEAYLNSPLSFKVGFVHPVA